jgi:hypothetical protein
MDCTAVLARGERRNTAASVRNAIGPSLPRMPKKFPLHTPKVINLATGPFYLPLFNLRGEVLLFFQFNEKQMRP